MSLFFKSSAKYIKPFYLLLILLGLPCFGQIESKTKKENLLLTTQKFSLGARIGTSKTYAHITDTDERSNFKTLGKSGYAVAGHLSMPVIRGINFIAESGFESIGRKMKDLNSGWVNDVNYNFLTASMGIQKFLTLKKNGHPLGNFYFSFGPGLTRLLGGKGKIITPGGQISKYLMVFNEADAGQYADFNRYFINRPIKNLFGIQLAFGGEIPISLKRNIQIELRTYLGQSTLGNAKTTHYLNILNFNDTMNLNLKTFSINIIYNFSFDTRALKQGKSSLKQPIRKK